VVWGAERCPQARGPAAGLRVDEGGAEDVRQRLDEPVHLRVEDAGLPTLDAVPGVLDKVPRQLVIAVGDLAVDLQASADVREVRRCSLPEIRQHSVCAVSDKPADLALGAEDVSAHPFPLDAPRGDLLQNVVDDRRQRAHERAVGGTFDEHDGEVVAEGRKFAVARQQHGPDGGVDGLQVLARRSRQVERDLPLGLGRLFHHHVPECVSATGQTVNLSSSASRPARMRSTGRACPARRRSS